MIYRKTLKCMICGNTHFDTVLDLGKQALTGIFPKSNTEEVPFAPLELIKCREDETGDTCGLLQLKYACDSVKLYGSNYGYRSGLNISMVNHLKNLVKKIEDMVVLQTDDLVIDIGCNDGTLLKSYKSRNILRAGVDPTGVKFKSFFPEDIILIADFFSSRAIQNKFEGKKAKIITSIAMFYDLEDPIDFMQQIYDILDDKGIWVFEQSYMPFMIEKNAYDTICHEHLEYYGLRQIQWMTQRVGFTIIDIDFNNVNGGSFAITVSKDKSILPKNANKINYYLKQEEVGKFNLLEPYIQFQENVFNHRDKLRKFVKKIKKKGSVIFGCGASTKGNVILQFCKFTSNDIPYISEVNEDKFGSFTPGTRIPILSEKNARKLKPDYFMVLPWHFKQGIIEREKLFLENGGQLVFPLPDIEIISNQTNNLGV